MIPAKLSAPKPHQAVQRERLFAMLDAAPGRFWICGPGGCGKTYLAASWLAARKYRPLWLQLDEDDAEPRTLFHYLAAGFGHLAPRRAARIAALARSAPRGYAPSFARGFARKLFELAPERTALAFDQVESVAERPAAMETLAVLIAEAPREVPVLFMSRTEPVPAFMPMRSRSELGLIGWDELRLTLEEAEALITMRHAGADARELHALSDGWAAGIVLMAERLRAGLPEGGVQRSALFDYFAREFLGTVPARSRDFLFAAAQLPSMTSQSAAAVSGHPLAEDILEDLARRNFFTVKLPRPQSGYRFHPLLREFLLQQAALGMTESALRATRERAAAALEATGEAAAAAEIHCALGAWDRLESLLARHGDSLLAQSRNRTVLAWIARVPPAELERRAWLRLWQARAWVEIDPSVALAQLESVWVAFELERTDAGRYQAWCTVVDCCFASFDFLPVQRWLPRFRALHTAAPAIADAGLARRVLANTYVAIAWWCPDAADYECWERRALELIRSEALPADTRLAIGSTLVHSWTFMGTDTSLAAEVTQRLRQLASSASVAPLIRLRWLWVDGTNGMRFDEDETLRGSFRNLSQAEAIVAEFGLQERGLSFFIGMQMVAQLMRGERAAADRAFERLLALPPAHTAPEVNRRDFMATLYYLHCNQPSLALQPAQRLAAFEAQNGGAFARIYSQSIVGLALHLNGHDREALRAFAQARRLGQRYRSRATLCWTLLGLALIALDRGNRGRCARLVRAGLDILVPLGHLRAFYLNREQMARLMAVAFEHDIHAQYVRRLIRIRRLAPPAGASDRDWPWALQIYALGGFELRREGKPLVFARKLPRKPLQILKFLVARGARPVRENEIVDALWPEESPTAGARAFATALHRLRRMVGADTIVARDGRLELDSGRVWVDAREFRHAEPQAAVALYRGPLLPGAHVEPWTLEARERLRRRYLQAVDALGAHAVQRGDWARAQAIYERALEVEPAAEQLHQGAIRCQLAMGLAGEAVAAYRRCERALRSTFGVPPSALTRRLVEQAAGPQSVSKR